MLAWLVAGEGESLPKEETEQRRATWVESTFVAQGQPHVLGRGCHEYFRCPLACWGPRGTAVQVLLGPVAPCSCGKPGDLKGRGVRVPSAPMPSPGPDGPQRWSVIGGPGAGVCSCLCSQGSGYFYFRQK